MCPSYAARHGATERRLPDQCRTHARAAGAVAAEPGAACTLPEAPRRVLLARAALARSRTAAGLGRAPGAAESDRTGPLARGALRAWRPPVRRGPGADGIPGQPGGSAAGRAPRSPGRPAG